MFQHILVPTDGSTLSADAVRKAVDLARAFAARITFFHAKPSYPTDIFRHAGTFEPISRQQFTELADGQAQRILAEAERVAKAAGVAYALRAEVSDAPYEGILSVAGQQHCDLIFMASHGRRGIGALLVGSETQKVLTHSKIPVLVCR
jgi:nucleotide-binding universal stress UspA family protein